MGLNPKNGWGTAFVKGGVVMYRRLRVVYEPGKRICFAATKNKKPWEARKEPTLTGLEVSMRLKTRKIIHACVLAVLAVAAGCATQKSARQIEYEAMAQAIEDMETAMQELLEVQAEGRGGE